MITICAYVIAGLLVVLMLMRERQWGKLLTNLLVAAQVERHDAREERRSLADRIQHPERVQVTPNPDFRSDFVVDTPELAHVGQIVPDYVQVGTEMSENGSS